MRAGPCICPPIGKIDYKQLSKINPEAARRAVLEYLKTSGGNISLVASTFEINRPVVYNIIRKKKEDGLKDRSRTPHYQPRKTPAMIEDKVIEVKNKTRFGPERLSRYLKQYKGISLAQVDYLPSTLP